MVTLKWGSVWFVRDMFAAPPLTHALKLLSVRWWNVQFEAHLLPSGKMEWRLGEHDLNMEA